MNLLLPVLLAALVVLAAGQSDLVQSLPGLAKQPSFKQYAGYINVNASADANMFYWFFESQNSPSTDPVVLWLTGGPGCSSELAVFFENGPFQVVDDGGNTLRVNPYSWNSRANVMFVDQPVGTGFSYVTNPAGYVRNIDEMASDLIAMIEGFMDLHPEFANRDFYVTGESYGGKWVPAISYAIFSAQQKGTLKYPIKLKGLAIGNGMIAPEIQYGHYGEFSYGRGLIDYMTSQQVEQIYSNCRALLLAGNLDQASTTCNQILSIIQTYGGQFNVYDVTQTCDPSVNPLCYPLDGIIAYMNRLDVRTALHVSNKKPVWETCDATVYKDIQSDWFKSQISHLGPLLDNNITVLIYSGDNDFICNFLGGEAVARSISWSGAAQYNSAQRQIWTIDGTIMGYAKHYGNLQMLTVKNAGHMVPHDQPVAALAMINLVIQGKPIVS